MVVESADEALHPGSVEQEDEHLGLGLQQALKADGLQVGLRRLRFAGRSRLRRGGAALFRDHGFNKLGDWQATADAENPPP